MLTLNQTIEILKNFSLKHKSLNDYFHGEQWDFGAAGSVKYPLMASTLLKSSYDNGRVTRSFQIDISDRVYKDDYNRDHVSSDTELICYDLINYFEQLSGVQDFLFTYKLTSDLTDYNEKRDDEVTGWYFTIDITTHLEQLSCNLPINSGNIFDDNYIYVGGQTVQNDFTVLIKDQDGNVIQTFNTSGEYMVTVLTNIQQVIGNTGTTIIQNIS